MRQRRSFGHKLRDQKTNIEKTRRAAERSAARLAAAEARRLLKRDRAARQERAP